ncbi:MAG: DUF349 domain-containing protein [Bacteroidota bacterium]|jgi:hypothetical protein
MDQNPANMEHQDDASENLNQGNEMENVNEAPSNEENTVEETVQQGEAAVENTGIAEEPIVVEAPSEVHEEEEHLNQLPVEEIEEVEAEVEPDEDFSQLSKQELLEKMEIYSKHDKVNAVKNRVNAARDVFQGIVQQEKSVALAKFLEEGGVKEEFDYQDQIEIKFFDAYKHYQKRRSEFVLGQEKIRQGNLKLKNEILSQMKNILQKEEDMSKAFNEFHELQAKWRGIGPVPPQNANDLWMTYKLYSDRFFEFIRLNRELQDLEMKKNLEMKIQLCERAEELMLEPSLNKAIQESQALQNKWREIGGVPREKRTEIWVRFKEAIDKIFENKRQYTEAQQKQFEGNLVAKTALLERAASIVNENYDKHTQWQEALQRLLELQTEWRKIGPTPKESNETIWNNFKTTCDQFFKNKDNYYKNKKQEFANNLQQKTELCVLAEALKDSTDWKATTQELIRLQQEWKKIGPAGDKNEKVWQRFKAVSDEYFARKTAHFAAQDEQQGENMKKKMDLIAEVEQYKIPEDANEAIEQLKVFQRSFTEIGLVPIKEKEAIQTRFRNAIQVHFNALKSKPEYKQAFRPRQDRPERQDRAPRNNEQKGGNDDSRNLKSKMEKLSSEVQLLENNLGFFANSKNASALREEYEQKIQKAKEEIAKLKAKMNELRNI